MYSPCIFEGKATPFKGVVDELKVFSRALSEREVASLYALHPVENAEQDCLVLRQEIYPPGRKDPDKARTFVALIAP